MSTLSGHSKKVFLLQFFFSGRGWVFDLGGRMFSFSFSEMTFTLFVHLILG